jgi:hypothetical protein
MNILIPSNRMFRGMTFLPDGQQMSGWLPKGMFAHGGEMDLVYSDLGVSKRARAVQLVPLGTQKQRAALGTWYVGTETAAVLTERHADPDHEPCPGCGVLCLRGEMEHTGTCSSCADAAYDRAAR